MDVPGPAVFDDDGVGQRRRCRDRGEDRRRQPRRLRARRRRRPPNACRLADQPIFNDPAGLDDEFANKGGARISPRDLAIVSRAVLARPDLVNVINTPHYEFTGGDGLGHTLNNHDLFLDLYPGRQRAEDRHDRARGPHVRRLGHRVAGARCSPSCSTPSTTTGPRARCSTRASTRPSRPRPTSTTFRRWCPTPRCRRRRAQDDDPQPARGAVAAAGARPSRRARASRRSTRRSSPCSCSSAASPVSSRSGDGRSCAGSEPEPRRAPRRTGASST